MQKVLPVDAQGVTVKLSTIDPNNNLVEIGETTSDIKGNFGFSWAPEVPGTYQIIATFEGSASYGAHRHQHTLQQSKHHLRLRPQNNQQP